MDADRASFLAADHRTDLEGPSTAVLQKVLAEVIAGHITDDDPPEVWQTAQRLLAAGLTPADVHGQLRMALNVQVMAAVQDDAVLDLPNYLAALGRLPLPHPLQLEELIVDVVRERQPIGADDVDRLVAERLGLSLDDPLVRTLVDRVQDDLLDPADGPLEMLSPDLLVHVPSFVDGIVLTHRLTEGEQASGVLVATDLPGLRRIGLRHRGKPVHDDEGDDGRSRWFGPRDWLTSLPAGALIAVRVHPDGEVQFTALDHEPDVAAELIATVRAAYDTEVEQPWLPVSAEELLLGVLARDRTAFDRARPPLTELAAAAGLEQRAGRYAHEESVWAQAERLSRTRRLIHELGHGPEVRAAMEALALLDDEIPDAAAAHRLLRLLHAPAVLHVVLDELLGTDDDPEPVAELEHLADRLLTLTRKPAEQAVAHWLAALAAERASAVHEAEAHLRAAVRADPGWPPAEDRLAWYESDRGDAVAAVNRWRRLGLTAEQSQDVATVAPFAAPAGGPKLGRNEPCWCGSGRKYKVCHLDRPVTAALPDRVGWLNRKAVAYLERRGGDIESVAEVYAAALADDPEDDEAVAAAMQDPLVLETVLHEGGWWARFLADRGPLLPADEALLAAAWTLVERTVCEVVEVTPGSGVTVRDLRTGDRIEVRERTYSRAARAGQLCCARVVPDGETHQFIGAVFPVAPGTEAELLELLDEKDGEELLDYVATMRRPPTLLTSDREPLLHCQAELAVTDPETARAALDGRYERDDEGWVSFIERDGERTVRARLDLDGSTITVRTLSGPRLDAVLTELRTALPYAQVVRDERTPVGLPTAAPATSAATSAAPAGAVLAPEALAELAERYERRWCEEQIPALGGRTPREAAADPTRRGQVARLIDSFPDIDPASGMFGLRPARLRELLGLSAH